MSGRQVQNKIENEEMTIMEEETAQRIATALEGIERALRARAIPPLLSPEEIEAEIARITATMGRDES